MSGELCSHSLLVKLLSSCIFTLVVESVCSSGNVLPRVLPLLPSLCVFIFLQIPDSGPLSPGMLFTFFLNDRILKVTCIGLLSHVET